LAIAAGILFPLSAEIAGLQDGDGILTSLISTQKLTWYFWGQDRLANLLPAIAAPIRDPEWNLRVQLFLRTFMSALAPAAVLVLFKQTGRSLLLATAVAQFMLAVTLSGGALYNIYAQHNPFSSSLVLYALSAIAFLRLRGALAAIACVVIAFLGYTTNLALLVLILPLLAVCAVMEVQPRRQLLGLMACQALAAGLAYAHAKKFGDSVTSFGVHISWQAIVDGWHGLSAVHVKLWPLALILIVAGIAAYRLRARETTTAWLIALGMIPAITGMSCLSWVQLNGYDIRYYLIFVITFAACCSYVLVRAVRMPEKTYSFQPLLASLLMAGVFFIGLRGLSANPTELVSPRWREQSDSTARIALQEGAQLIVGDFWDVWPAVFDSRERLHQAGLDAQPLYGAAFRGHVLRKRIMKLIRERGEVTSVCFKPDVEDCIRTTDMFITGAQPVRVVPGSIRKIDDGKLSLLVYRITSIQPQAQPADEDRARSDTLTP
jgi:hypothetical protein